MPEHAQILRIVVASPSDVKSERDIVPLVVEELNRGIADDRGLHLEVIRWETDTYPGFHPEGPQSLIDEILRIEDCDVVIGIFWKRFGTPTEEGTTGTEHEIRRAYDAWKKQRRPQVMVYFNQTPATPQSEEETRQWGQLLKFRKEFPKEGLWWSYAGTTEFERLLRTHLTNFIRDKFRIDATGGDKVKAFVTVAAPAPGTAMVNPPPAPAAREAFSEAIATESADGQLLHRPKITVRNVVVRGLEHLNRSSPMSKWTQDLTGYYAVVNLGGTPAIIERVIEGAWVLKELPMERPDRNNVGREMRIHIKPGGSAEVNFEHITLSMDDTLDLIEGKSHAYFIARIQYSDTGKIRRETSTCRVFDPTLKRFVRVDNPDYEYSD
jgi:hypothetical protein